MKPENRPMLRISGYVNSGMITPDELMSIVANSFRKGVVTDTFIQGSLPKIVVQFSEDEADIFNPEDLVKVENWDVVSAPNWNPYAAKG